MSLIFPNVWVGTFVPRTKAGTTVDAVWCDVHDVAVMPDDMGQTAHGIDYCPRADEDGPGCRFLPLVIGTEP